ncbi:unnamed protein product [Larinioides sclopetarius]|uniref:NET domain-containing protein n=1 Tax=Larinioides sclopetarius TaxID=280406 RepID=A0AAV1ZLI1_9ARAC
MARIEELFVDMSQSSSYEDLAAMHLHKRPVKGIVQPPVKPPEGKSHRNTNLLLFMLDVVLTICKHPDSWPFRKPVDALHLKIPEIVSMAKTIEKIFVQEMAKCTEKEIELPLPIKASKSKEKGRKKKNPPVSTKTESCSSETWTPTSFPVGRTSIVQTRKVHKRSWSCSSDSSASSSDFEKEIEEMKERVKKLTEALEYLIKELNDSRKRKLERRNKRKLKKELSCAPVVKQKIVCNNESPLVAALPDHSVSASVSLNNTLNKFQNQKQPQKSSSKHICGPKRAIRTKKGSLKCAYSSKPVAQTKKCALKRACSPMPTAEAKKRKTNPKKQLMFPDPAPSVSTGAPNGDYRMKMDGADLKPMSFEEKSKLSEELSKVGENATAAVTNIIKNMEPSLYDATSAELELDINALKLPTLKELQKYVKNLKKGTYDEEDTSSTTSTSSSSSSGEPFLFHSDDSSSSSNTSNDGKKNSTANSQLKVMSNASAAAHPDSTTNPVKVDKIPAQSNSEFYFPGLKQNVIKSEPCHQYFEESKSLFPGPSTSTSVSYLKNYTGASHGPPKESSDGIGTIKTLDVDRRYGYTRITKRLEQAEKKAQLDPQNQRFNNTVENAKRTMKMRENTKKQFQNQADQYGKCEVEIKKEI